MRRSTCVLVPALAAAAALGAIARPALAHPEGGSQAALAAPPACGLTPANASFFGHGGPFGTTPTAFTLNVSTPNTYLWDVDMVAGMLHTSCGDIDMTLTSPAGTVVTITTDNGGALDHVFSGTTWDDDVNDPVTTHVYTNAVAATPLSPEGRLAAFRGENPNGVWTLTIVDDFPASDVGDLWNWSLNLATLAVAPAQVSATFTQPAPLITIPAAGTPTITDTLQVAGIAGPLTGLEVQIDVSHSWTSDLRISITSPAGTIVPLAIGVGLNLDDIFRGTRFHVDAPKPVTDYPYIDHISVTEVSPQGAFDVFAGEDPNGTWTLTIHDNESGEGGLLSNWNLKVTSCGGPPPVGYCFGDGSGTLCPCSPAPVPHGAAGNGCPSNLFPAGAHLEAAGVSSLALDTLVLLGSQMINSTVLYFQGDAQTDVTFGDGKRCATTSVKRFKVKTNVSNASQYPGVGDNPISVAAAIAAPGVKHYQGWYRSANPTFCPVATFNLTNAVSVTWTP